MYYDVGKEGFMASKINWDDIKTEYITTKISQRALAKKYGISAGKIAEHCKRGKWVEQRERYRSRTFAKTLEKTSNKEADRLARLISATTKAIDVSMEAFEDEQQFKRYIVTEGIGGGATETTEKIFQKVDTKALKDLTGVLKDLTALMRDFYNIPTPAQAEAQRIAAARLEMEQKKAEADTVEDNNVEIVFANGMEDYAK